MCLSRKKSVRGLWRGTPARPGPTRPKSVHWPTRGRRGGSKVEPTGEGGERLRSPRVRPAGPTCRLRVVQAREKRRGSGGRRPARLGSGGRASRRCRCQWGVTAVPRRCAPSGFNILGRQARSACKPSSLLAGPRVTARLTALFAGHGPPHGRRRPAPAVDRGLARVRESGAQDPSTRGPSACGAPPFFCLSNIFFFHLSCPTRFGARVFLREYTHPCWAYKFSYKPAPPHRSPPPPSSRA